MEDVGSSDNAR